MTEDELIRIIEEIGQLRHSIRNLECKLELIVRMRMIAREATKQAWQKQKDEKQDNL